MPDENGTLDELDKQKVRSWLENNWKSKACPYSGHTSWDLSRSVFVFKSILGKESFPILPCITITCTGCGHIVFIDATKIGLVKVS